MIESNTQIQSLFQQTPIASGVTEGQPASSKTPGFDDIMKQVLNHVNSLQQDSSNRMEAVETGASDDLLGAMIASQKSSLAFQSLLQVRNKVVSAYEEVMRMQV
ncbi:flagellar hook-basal body complex protein FliE [Sansalvadorimonas verongulae]|uniref:flagellar hook-basal body complex protein FliE n=1 Tax=Sansalvadorimonas verongulae TaxID=2172824 RepID=UPI0012BD4A9F|nr:flagellar hook-basal body complex protein FliE [Sansalvadorimonas verongulae]MTI13482.1 flagellar hook-basal body complex protein FliE [Sansalvadorimonas verongulae]